MSSFNSTRRKRREADGIDAGSGVSSGLDPNFQLKPTFGATSPRIASQSTSTLLFLLLVHDHDHHLLLLYCIEVLSTLPLFLRAPRINSSPTTTSFIGVSSSLGPSRAWQPASPYSHSQPTSAATTPNSSAFTTTTTSTTGDKKSDDYFPAQPPPRLPKMPPQTNVSLNSPVLSIFAYCGSSILMTVANKYCVSGTGWNLSFFLLAIQVRYPSKH